MSGIHPTAAVESGARIGTDVFIGPYCCVGPEVELGPGVRLLAHVVIAGRTKIGAGTVVSPFASIGHPPQHLTFTGEPSELVIGERNVIREYVTINSGTAPGRMGTHIGDDGFFMISAHIAHDCRIGDHVIMANNATLGGHVEVGSHAVIGGLSAIHQHVRIGQHAMVGGMSAVAQDVIPYGLVVGNRAQLTGLNLVGLKRRGFSRPQIHALRGAYRQLFADGGNMLERLEGVATAYKDHNLVMDVVDFIRSDSARSLCRPRARDVA
jgi:UDP-N-acetylglucosamine acyltransferase